MKILAVSTSIGLFATLLLSSPAAAMHDPSKCYEVSGPGRNFVCPGHGTFHFDDPNEIRVQQEQILRQQEEILRQQTIIQQQLRNQQAWPPLRERTFDTQLR